LERGDSWCENVVVLGFHHFKVGVDLTPNNLPFDLISYDTQFGCCVAMLTWVQLLVESCSSLSPWVGSKM